MSFEDCKKLFKENDTYEIGFIDGIKTFDRATNKEVNYGKTKGNDQSKKAYKTR